jgi:hypothetical protein
VNSQNLHIVPVSIFRPFTLLFALPVSVRISFEGRENDMGFWASIKRIINGNSAAEEAELDAARARHGIAADEIEKAFRSAKEQREAANFDAWEELKYFKTDFIMGNWASKKLRPFFGAESLKKDIDKLEEKRRQEDLRLMELERLAEEERKKREGG